MKIKYQNVGSLRNAEVEFNLGKLTLIRGETNQGKSLLFYSLADGLLNNSTFKRWINNKALEENLKANEVITLIDDLNNVYEIKANQNSFQYKVNNEEPFEKVRGKTLFELLNRQIQGFLYSPDEQNPLVNIVQENEGFFPINRSDAQIYKTYERLLALTDTQTIMRNIKFDSDDIDNQQKERTQLLQKYQSQQINIIDTLKTIDENKLNEIEQNLINYYNNYVRLVNICNSVQKDDYYINVYNSLNIPVMQYFDVNRFSRLLDLYVKQTNINKVSESLKKLKIEKTETFDLSKINSLNQSYTTSIQLQNDITQINQLIEQDSKLLEDIQLKLKDVKVCPLCGKPMEDEHETVHS